MTQRFQPIPGVQLGDVAGAKRVQMSAVDSAIAAIPGLLHDVDVSRLKPGIGVAGRARASGVQITGEADWQLVESNYLDGNMAIRNVPGANSRTTLLGSFDDPEFTIAVICTMGASIRDVSPPPVGPRTLLSVYNASNTLVTWLRMNGGSGTIGFSMGLGGAPSPMIERSAMPAANAPMVLSVERTNSGRMALQINGVETGSVVTDAAPPVLSSSNFLTIGGLPPAGASTNRWDGDIARLVIWKKGVASSYPALWAAFIAAAKAEYGIAT